MVTIDINGIEYNAFNKWNEITLKRFILLCNCSMPEKLFNLYKSVNDPEQYKIATDLITDADNFGEYFGKVIKILTDLPEAIISLILPEDREAIYYRLFHHIALSSVLDYPMDRPDDGQLSLYQPEIGDSFELSGETFLLPKSLRMGDIEIPMAGEPIVTFTEASDIMGAWRQIAEKGSGSIALIAGIYCRKDGEVYSQEVAMDRAKKFEELTMDVYWRLFFCMDRLIRRLVKDMPERLADLVTRKIDRLQMTPGLIRLVVGD